MSDEDHRERAGEGFGDWQVEHDALLLALQTLRGELANERRGRTQVQVRRPRCP